LLDSGFWILDSGFWILDSGFWILDSGFWILDSGFKMHGFTIQVAPIQESSCRIQVALIQDSRCTDSGFRITDTGTSSWRIRRIEIWMPRHLSGETEFRL